MSSSWGNSWGTSWARSWGFVPTTLPQGGGTSRRLRRGRIPRKYSDLQDIYREHRDDLQPPQVLLDAAQEAAEVIAGPTIPEVYRESLLTALLPFIDKFTALDAAEAGAIERMVDWKMMVQDREAMQTLIGLRMAIEEDDDEDFQLMSIH